MRRIDSGASFHPSFVHAARELFAEYREKLRVHQMILKSVEHPFLELIPPDVEPVFAGAFVPRSRAAHERLRDHRIAAAAAGASGQSREQVLGALPLMQPVRLAVSAFDLD